MSAHIPVWRLFSAAFLDGVTTRYAYDAAGRLVKEGDKTYRYGYLDKVLSVTEGERKYAYDYHVDGQLAKADYGDASEDFLWDGLALVKRGGERFVNEPHVGGGNPVASSKGTTYFNDMLGTTLGTATGRRKERKYSAAVLTAFGEDLSLRCPPPPNFSTSASASFFTGKPHVAGLGHAFLFRNYRAGLAKWQTADPLGYPDGWNQLAYCGNGVMGAVDLWGCIIEERIVNFDSRQSFFVPIPWFNSEWISFARIKEFSDAAKREGESVEKYVQNYLNKWRKEANKKLLHNSLQLALIRFFSEQQGGDYSEIVPQDVWSKILDEYSGWELVSGPNHLGITPEPDTDVVNAGVGALIFEGCTHHWQAKFRRKVEE